MLKVRYCCTVISNFDVYVSEDITEVLNQLCSEVANLRLEIEEVKGKSTHVPQIRMRYKSHGKYAGEGICWYHQKSGPKSTKCT